MTTEVIPAEHIVVFNDQQIRSVMHNDEWFYSVVDIISTLTDSNTPKRYWSDLKAKLLKEEEFQLYDFIVQLKFKAADGKNTLPTVQTPKAFSASYQPNGTLMGQPHTNYSCLVT